MHHLGDVDVAWMRIAVFMLAGVAGLIPPERAFAAAGAPPARTRNVTVFGGDACPASTGEDIVVCARLPESDRYRIPKQLREAARVKGPRGQSWTAQVRIADEATRFTRPDSCSPVGTWGQTGCTQMWLRQWAAERRATQQ